MIPLHCGHHHAAPVDGCVICFKAANDDRYRAYYAGERATPAPVVRSATPTARRELPCVHEGDIVRPCGSCAADRAEARHVRACDVFGECARGEPVVAHVCATCDRYRPDPALLPAPPAPLALTEVGPDGLSKGRSGYAFNAGLLRFKGRLLLAYRTDWSGAHCHVAELAEDYTPRRTVVLPHLAHPLANVGREDPRLFVFRGRLHIAYIGVERISSGVRTNQMYARLTDDLQVEEVFAPEYAHRREWEKNWAFFEWAGELFAVYAVAPHVVLHVRGNRAYPFAETPTVFPWSGGHLRGGAAPVLVGDRFYHWFHGRDDTDWCYNVGLYTFEAKPPFRVLSMTPDPLLWGDRADTDGNYCAVAFPCGALLEGGRWKVGMGWNDRRVKVAEWAEEEIAAAVGHRADPPAFVLVCDELQGRKAAALETTAPLGVKPWRSVHGSTWGLATTKTYDRDTPGYRIAAGHVGLILGHYALWQHLWESGAAEAVVFEDDAVPPSDFWARLAAARRTFPAGWQLVYLGTVGGEWGTHAYLVTRAGLRVLLDTMAEARANVDIQIRENTAGKLVAHRETPSLVPQRADWPTSAGEPATS